MSDIFISYAHVDNQPMTEGEKGWITHLINHLRNEISRKMGRAENYELWMDFRLKGSDELTPAIEDQLVKTHALVILLSPGWLASEWCQRELKVFAQHLAHPAGRIFVVELDQIALKDKPPVLHDLLTYRFWQKTDQERIKQLGYPVPLKEHEAYYDRLRDLSNDLATSLKAKQVAKPAVTTQTESTVQSAQATVYVAPVNDALYEQRASLISNLRQLGIAALPLNNDWDESNSTLDIQPSPCATITEAQLRLNWLKRLCLQLTAVLQPQSWIAASFWEGEYPRLLIECIPKGKSSKFHA